MSAFWWGVFGTTIGSGVTLLGQWIKHCWETSKAEEFDNRRKAMLRSLLDKPGSTGWRKMATLSGVIGASREETARLLIEIEARGSETGNDSWAYLKDKPLPDHD
ncbi:hypothetical protein [Sphingopyxis panaciterrulae]|uniref:Uncharacterized protein n=1 Tax=Sphingopyxis panaciterrulae TaxID=462372 RepID=A0A7W9ETS1_9SPHN|nr:hypothetical protein [Sphingopyxis panaciterrulae]MBB5708331.1 hypothetical protein [Sphingopyxis panaciterrulae]